jgi:hypothetical protein
MTAKSFMIMPLHVFMVLNRHSGHAMLKKEEAEKKFLLIFLIGVAIREGLK